MTSALELLPPLFLRLRGFALFGSVPLFLASGDHFEMPGFGAEVALCRDDKSGRDFFREPGALDEVGALGGDDFAAGAGAEGFWSRRKLVVVRR